MKNKKTIKLYSLFLGLVLCMGALAGCQKSASSTPSVASSTAASSSASAAESTAPVANTDTPLDTQTADSAGMITTMNNKEIELAQLTTTEPTKDGMAMVGISSDSFKKVVWDENTVFKSYKVDPATFTASTKDGDSSLLSENSYVAAWGQLEGDVLKADVIYVYN